MENQRSFKVVAGALWTKLLGNVPGQVGVAALLLCGAAAVWAGDWPQYRGANGDGISSEQILHPWAAEGPRLVWRRSVTDGFSSFTVGAGRAYTLVKRPISGQNQEVCLGLNADTGAELWARPVGRAQYTSGGNDGAPGNTGGDGPRSTPVVRGDRVYVLSAYLVLSCLEAATGRIVWSRDLVAEYGGTVISWQNAASPVIEGDLILVNCNAPGRSLVALRIGDGSLAWGVTSEAMTHATPVVGTLQGVRQVVFLTQSGLIALLPQTGATLWRYTFPYSTSTGASPVIAGDLVYCSAAYNVGAAAVRITRSGDRFTATQAWRRTSLMNHWSTPVYCNGYLYGLYGYGQYGSAPLKCISAATGTERWSQDGFGLGGVLLVGDVLVVLSDSGELVLVAPDPRAYNEVSRFQAVAGKCWNTPAVSDGRIYVRSTREAACLDVAVPPPPPLRLLAVRSGSGSPIVVSAASSDGQPIDTVRADRIELLATTNLQLPLANWSRLTHPWLLTNGLLRTEVTMGGSTFQYLKAVESP